MKINFTPGKIITLATAILLVVICVTDLLALQSPEDAMDIYNDPEVLKELESFKGLDGFEEFLKKKQSQKGK